MHRPGELRLLGGQELPIGRQIALELLWRPGGAHQPRFGMRRRAEQQMADFVRNRPPKQNAHIRASGECELAKRLGVDRRHDAGTSHRVYVGIPEHVAASRRPLTDDANGEVVRRDGLAGGRRRVAATGVGAVNPRRFDARMPQDIAGRAVRAFGRRRRDCAACVVKANYQEHGEERVHALTLPPPCKCLNGAKVTQR